MEETRAPEVFVRLLQGALQSLYDPVELQRGPLLGLLGLDRRRDPASALQQFLTDAIHSLRPATQVPPEANSWRIYNVLTYRYVEQTSQVTVAANLGFSVRQLRRQERMAEQKLADYLWTRHNLAERAALLPALPPASEKADEAGEESGASPEIPDRQQELDWLRRSFPSEFADPASVVAAAVKVITPLAQVLNVQVESEVPVDLPPLAGQVAAVREALLNLLMAGVRVAQGGVVQVAAVRCGDGIRVEITADHLSPPAAPGGKTAEYLEMARQLIALFGGALRVVPAGQEGTAFVAVLTLPVAEQIPVLVIDDNADTLALLHRYLAGTRYYFAGTHSPEQALELAQEWTPRVIVLDLMLPNVDGWELLGRLRAHPATRGIPIIISTILPQEELAMALGAASFLRKPVSREALLSALDAQADSPSRGSC